VELAKLGKVMQKLDLKNPDMAKLIFVSVDPKRDTPEVLKKFAERRITICFC
jgi:cytochrome oxidase Cu insertion factor (SCO1/SenC/PrrC family)